MHSILRGVMLCFFALLLSTAAAQQKGGDQRIYLDRSDELRYDEMRKPGVQIVKGHVAFHHRGTRLSCDSAYFNQKNNSFEAFGHVYMVQGDTLTLSCDRAFYDGRPEVEMVYARKNVKVVHRKSSELYTDSLNYDRKFNFVYYAEGGHFIDKKKKVDLVSDWGRYNLDTREAVAYYSVVLKSPDYEINTDTLYYDARLERAQIVSRSTIYNVKNDYQIVTSNGYYYMSNDKSELYDHSTIENKDRIITGDSLYYDSKLKRSHGFGNVVYTDKKNKNQLISGHFTYDEKTGEGFATRRPVFADFSQKDTLWLHADSMRVKTFHIDTDSMYREVYCYHHVRAYRVDMQAMCDSLVICSRDSSITMLQEPIVWYQSQQLTGDQVIVFMRDSTIREAHVEGNSFTIQEIEDKDNQQKRYQQISSKRSHSFFDEKGNLRMNEAQGNVMVVFHPQDEKDSTLIGMVYAESDTLRAFLNNRRKMEKIWMPKAEGVMYPMTQIPLGKDRLPKFEWYEELRPLKRDDIFIWPEKKKKGLFE